MEQRKPKMIVSNKGVEPTSSANLARADAAKGEWHTVAPCRAIRNSSIQSFDGRLSDELLNAKPCERLIFSLQPFKRQ